MHFRLSFKNAVPEELVADLEKAVVYASEHLRSLRVTSDRRAADLECHDGAQDEVADKVARFVEAMVGRFRSLGPAEEIARGRRCDEGPIVDAWAELERRRWVRPLARGLVGLAGGALALRRFIDDATRDVARSGFAADEEDYPALIDASALVRAGYLSSFPQSISLVAHLREDFDAIEAFRAANTDTSALEVPDAGALDHGDAILRPAVCIPVYHALQDMRVPEGGLAITTAGRVFRYESSHLEGLRRLWDFSMREIVFVGSADFVAAQRARVIDAMTSLMDAWDLEFRLASASDPFFATVRATKALWQRSRGLKYELMVDVGGREIAAASINFAGSLFGDAFRIQAASGETANTACVGFGLERLVLALFSQHGFDPGRWPGALREVVFG